MSHITTPIKESKSTQIDAKSPAIFNPEAFKEAGSQGTPEKVLTLRQQSQQQDGGSGVTGAAGGHSSADSTLSASPTKLVEKPSGPFNEQPFVDATNGNGQLVPGTAARGMAHKDSQGSDAEHSQTDNEESPAPTFDPAEEKYTKLLQDEFYSYDVEIMAVALPSQAEQTEVRKVFKQVIGMNDKHSDTIRVNGNCILAKERKMDWEGKYFVPIRRPAELRSPNPPKPAGEGWRKVFVHDQPMEGKAIRQRPKVGDLESMEDQEFRDRVKDGVDNPDLSSGVDIDTRKTKLLILDKRENLTKAELEIWTDFAIVFAKRSMVTINDIRTMTCWADARERTTMQQIESLWASTQVKSQLDPEKYKDAMLLGFNHVYYNPQALDCGLERREGLKVQIAMHDDGEKYATTTLSTQHFFKPVLVSQFMTDYFGEKNIDCTDEAQVAQLNNLLKGVKSIPAYSGRTKPAVIEAIDARTAGQILIAVSGSEPKIITLAERYEMQLGKPLRHASLPCIDIGTEKRHFFYPAEACKIVEGQPFSHQLPFHKADNVFTLRQAKEARDKLDRRLVSEEDNPFDTVNSKRYNLIFAEVIVLPEDVPLYGMDDHRHGLADDWRKFQYQIGQRYGKKLETAVKQSQHMHLPRRPSIDTPTNWEERLKDSIKNGISYARPETTLIVSVPNGQHFHEMRKLIRRICDTRLGIQCNIVNTMTLTDACRDQSGMSLMHYTGRIVTSTFMRAVEPPKLSKVALHTAEYRSRFASEMVPEHGLSVGNHVVPLASFMEQSLGCNPKPYRLVTITSHYNGTIKKRGEDLRTTHHLVSLRFCETMAEKINKCMEMHLDGRAAYEDDRYEATHIIYYRSGEDDADRIFMSEEVNSLSFLNNNDYFKRVQHTALVTYVTEPTVTLHKDSGPIALNEINYLVRTNTGANLASSAFEMQLFQHNRKILSETERAAQAGDLSNPFGLNAAVANHYIRKLDEVQQGQKTYLVTHCHELQAEGNQTKQRDRAKSPAESRVAELKKQVGVLKDQLNFARMTDAERSHSPDRIAEVSDDEQERLEDERQSPEPSESEPKPPHEDSEQSESPAPVAATKKPLIDLSRTVTPAILKNSHKVDLFRCRLAEGAEIGHVHYFHGLLKQTTSPDMCYLAQQASARMRVYVQKGDGEDVSHEKILFSMSEIHVALEHSLYFL